jgi:ATP-dependent Clp protease ATP-binding subunit ClpA
MSVSLSQSLERSLRRAASVAQDQGRERATPEDLLLALTDDDDAVTAMRAMRIDLDLLRHDIETYMDGAVDEDTDAPSEVPNYTSDLHGILQRASTHVQTSGRGVVDGADMLVELFAEPAGHFLQNQDLTRYDLVSFLSHGIAKDPVFAKPSAAASMAYSSVHPENADGSSHARLVF